MLNSKWWLKAQFYINCPSQKVYMTERRSLSTYTSQKTGPRWNVLLFLGELFNSHCTIYWFNSHEMCDNKIRSRTSGHTGFPAFYEFRQPSISSSSQTASLPYVLTFQSSEGTSYITPSVLLVIPLPIVSCQCVTYNTSLYPISFPKTKTRAANSCITATRRLTLNRYGGHVLVGCTVAAALMTKQDKLSVCLGTLPQLDRMMGAA